MTNEELENYEFDLILKDFKFLYESLMECLESRLHYTICVGLFQFVNFVVGESFNYMLKNDILQKSDPSANKLMRELENLRSKSVKMYSNANDCTLEKLIDFTEEEYKKLFEFNREKSTTSLKISNYNISYIDCKPISNYHLMAKKILNIEIGVYNEDLNKQINDYVKKYMTLIKSILEIFDSNSLNYTPSLSLNFNVKSLDYTLTESHNDFNFSNTEILMAFLDICCVINFDIYVISKFNPSRINDLRFKYMIFYNSILGMLNIKSYCDKRHICFPFYNELDQYLLENAYLIEDDLRNICGHYGFKNYKAYDDPIKGAFENYFKMNLEQISKMLSEKLIYLSNLINKIVFKPNINQ